MRLGWLVVNKATYLKVSVWNGVQKFSRIHYFASYSCGCPYLIQAIELFIRPLNKTTHIRKSFNLSIKRSFAQI